MIGSYEVAATGLAAQQRALQIISNNISNINTPGYKKSSINYADMVAALDGQTMGLGGVNALPNLLINGQGEIQNTGNKMDIAIDGTGFIELLGRDGQFMFWRGGTLQINHEGYLAGPHGTALRAMIQVPSDAKDLAIDETGVVTAVLGGGSDRTELGRIELAILQSANDIERLDGGLYRFTGINAPEMRSPGEDGVGRLIQGSIELSTVDLNDEMVRMLIVQRAYAANAQVIQAGDQLMSISNNLRRT
ncbi:flagellar hook-basal body protein [Candidatus Phycosocius spiralis]|uniref:Flagellar basal body rod protein FlgG n=1 Tax=Candidatus Phycosocius spiralis TaxID=2815099 RepID=A0ABQ4PYG8_9PROT|nr:flagellar hook-basal body complex protein [Candidatus Phycosocius spiralis]GIU68063.1 flagellar basal body rod protein FlgG [Candidatus Phycosocius spiralis]